MSVSYKCLHVRPFTYVKIFEREMILATILAITILFADIIIFADVAHHSMRMKPPTEMILCYLLPIKIASKLTVPFEMPKGQVLKTAMFLVSWMINVSPEIFNSHVGPKSLCEHYCNY